ncbi:MAG: S8 family serine peptidase [Gammaproteobacteria bacterium]|nr:S8 family serine peptidase [Gammaproteobacteria bacterium]
MFTTITRQLGTCLLLTLLILILGACSKSNNNGNTLLGTILVFDGSSVDSDVNDPRAPYQSNDSPLSAQPLSNPSSLGGYVNQPATGPDGRSFISGDVNDYFSITLLQGQVISLQISDAGSNNSVNLDLFLLAEDGRELGVSATDEATESITVNATGKYLIQVTAVSGASVYNLSIGLDASIASAANASIVASEAYSAYPDLNADADFVPGEIIVQFNASEEQGTRQKSTQATTGVSLSARIDALGLEYLSGVSGRNVLLAIPEGQAAFRALGIRMTHSAFDARQKKINTLNVISALRQRDDVVFASPNYIRYASQLPNDAEYGKQWHYPIINLPQAWDITTGNSSVIVGVIDTGVLLNHPDINNQIVGGYDFIVNRGPDNERDATPGIDDDANDPGDGIFSASSFHGTHVAGIVAAETNNDTAVAGVAWSVKIMPLRVLGPFGGSDYDIGQAVLYAAGLPNDSGTVPAQRADVINLSLGGPIDVNDIPGLSGPFKQARDAGVIIIAAAGNDGKSTLYYPASLDGVVSVSATDISKELASYSNFGATVDVSAPGGDFGDINGDGFFDGVFSLSADDSVSPLVYGTTLAAGTSMAAPHVAGVVALMKSVFPAMTPDDFDALLASGVITQDLGEPGRDNFYGHGMIDALKAVEVAGGDIPVIPDVAVAFPSSLNFSLFRSTMAFNLTNGGNVGNLLIQNIVNDSSGWLTVKRIDSLTDEGTNLGFYEAIIDRAKLPSGVRTLTANIRVIHRIDEVEKTLTIPVIAQSSSERFGNNAGFHYVLLIASNATANGDGTVQAERSVAVAVNEGRYNFTMTDIATGRYSVVAGTDLDNDGVICDVGEACGRYPTRDKPSVIELGGASDNESKTIEAAANTAIQFETGFSLRLGASQAGANDLIYRRIRD